MGDVVPGVRDYYDEHGKIDIPEDTVLSNGRMISTWLEVQRRYQGGKIHQYTNQEAQRSGMIWVDGYA